MEISTKILEEIGLSKSEIKVYLALLTLGSSTKKAIVTEAKINPSKLYEITDKLINKGLVSYVKKNKVMHFSAAPPEQILDFLQQKKEKITKQEKEFASLIPSLKSLEKQEEPQIEVFRGWKGMRTAYKMILNNLQSGDTDYVIGATSGEDKTSVERFFKKFHNDRRKKKIKIKILSNQKDKQWTQDILTNKKLDHVRYLKHTSPSEVNIWNDNVMIIILTKIPVVTLIKSKVTADSFKNYFKSLWKIAEP